MIDVGSQPDFEVASILTIQVDEARRFNEACGSGTTAPSLMWLDKMEAWRIISWLEKSIEGHPSCIDKGTDLYSRICHGIRTASDFSRCRVKVY